MGEELVILVDENNRPIGTAPKVEVHHAATPLHRGFSCFLWNRRGEVLLQRRATTKVTWPGVWSNSFCGHPAPGEEGEAAVRRRLEAELGIVSADLALAEAGYRYRAELDGIVENEFCPIWVGVTDAEPAPSPDEVDTARWMPWEQLVEGIRAKRDPFFASLSPWALEETLILADGPALAPLLERIGAAA